MHPHTQASIKLVVTAAKTAVLAFGRIIAKPRKTMPANCTNINALLMHLCDFDERTYRYLVKWLAYPLQNPGAKMQYAIFMNRQEGTGCTLFFSKIIAQLYAHAARAVRDKNFHSFNGWALDARFAVIETKMPSEFMSEMKSMVSSPQITIQRQAQVDIEVPNRINMVFLSGSMNPLSLDACDRRFFVVEAPPRREKLFYDAVLAEIENGGIEAFRDYLMHGVDLSDFNQFSEPPRLAVSGRLVA